MVYVCVVTFFVLFNFLSLDRNSRILLVVSVCIGQSTLFSKPSCISVLLYALSACLAKAEKQSVFKKLLGKGKDAWSQDAHTQDSDTRDTRPLDTQTLVSFLKLFQDTNPELRVALLQREHGSGEAPQQAGRKLGATSGKVSGQPYRETLYPDVGGLSRAGQDPGAFLLVAGGVAVQGSPHCCLEGWINGWQPAWVRAELSLGIENFFFT